MYTLKSNNVTHELLEKKDINNEITSLKELCVTMQSSIQNNLTQINNIKEDITTVKEDIINIKKGTTPVASEGGI
jgi:peptidoglycan hydrolase CwlO-like protein